MQGQAASLDSQTIRSSVLGTDALLTGRQSEWWNMQAGPGRDQALLDAQLHRELAAWGSQTPPPAPSAPPPSKGLVASPSILPPPLPEVPAARLPSLSSPPPPPQDLAAGSVSIQSPPATPPQQAPKPKPKPTTTIKALLSVCPYKLESRRCPYGIRCTMRTPCDVCSISIPQLSHLRLTNPM